MDKKNLYYIIKKGTNIRKKIDEEQYFIADLEYAESERIESDKASIKFDKYSIVKHEIISVEKYEEKFGVYKIDTKIEFKNEMTCPICGSELCEASRRASGAFIMW